MTDKQKEICAEYSRNGARGCAECPLAIDVENRECIASLEQSLPASPEVSVFDRVERIENCTVEILTNTKTGETSIGWWRND